jgi:hypothetical protein
LTANAGRVSYRRDPDSLAISSSSPSARCGEALTLRTSTPAPLAAADFTVCARMDSNPNLLIRSLRADLLCRATLATVGTSVAKLGTFGTGRYQFVDETVDEDQLPTSLCSEARARKTLTSARSTLPCGSQVLSEVPAAASS